MTPKTLHPCHTPATAPLNVKSPRTQGTEQSLAQETSARTPPDQLALPCLARRWAQAHRETSARQEERPARHPSLQMEWGGGTQSPLGVTLQPIISKSTSEGTLVVAVFLFLAYVT